jgi:hypothetical protein
MAIQRIVTEDGVKTSAERGRGLGSWPSRRDSRSSSGRVRQISRERTAALLADRAGGRRDGDRRRSRGAAGAFPDLGSRRSRWHLRDGRDSDQLWVRFRRSRLLEVMRFLRDDPRCKFEQLCDLTCIDYLNYPDAEDRFGVIYSLLSHTHQSPAVDQGFVNDPEPEVPSVTSIWKGAEWPEREVFDMFGSGSPAIRTCGGF